MFIFLSSFYFLLHRLCPGLRGNCWHSTGTLLAKTHFYGRMGPDMIY
ncbi:hypothetical protein CLOBOL_00822 [Enterocloster bolteae ATCC BAA-613]|uniref:Uncharacterized protein n=1 Tax=Enterocloster bolteae (strain ATCC BAA-613 / DSM 15670 / CCUG 46953 / JCM 12243 / WAL 16351) TaxID=411902 RepID=A8RIX9_ENTBW|nr:hypothetical protein CLOBOL_00822 [Enterocloster bolteae ATCC BAA-613]